MTIIHASSGKNVQDILFLRKMKTSRCTGDRDTKKMMKRAEILHGKFMTKSSSDGGKKDWRGGCENNIIDI